LDNKAKQELVRRLRMMQDMGIDPRNAIASAVDDGEFDVATGLELLDMLRQVELSHAVDDVITVNEKYTRTTLEVVDLLITSLDALRTGSPDVTVEYVNRAVRNLTGAVTMSREVMSQ
jgi:hypothetical protein